MDGAAGPSRAHYDAKHDGAAAAAAPPHHRSASIADGERSFSEARDVSPSSGPAGAEEKKNKTSCLACRESKVRCIPPAGAVLGAGACVRCLRQERECVFKEHKRGRRPGKVKHAQIDRRWTVLVKLLDELAELTSAVADTSGAALVRSLRYQVLSSSAVSTTELGIDTMSPPPPPPPVAESSESVVARSQAYYSRPAHHARSGVGSAVKLVELEDSEAQGVVPMAIETLTNPLKLLAQASDTVQEEEDRRRGRLSSHRRELESAEQPLARRSSRAAATDSINWRSYFMRGIFNVQYDVGPDLDPIERGIMTLQQGVELVDWFQNNLSTFVHIFDRDLCTFDYIQRRSAFLLTVVCATAAEVMPNTASGLHARLRKHVEHLQPIMLCGGYKSVEISQACCILAQYSPLAKSATDDPTFSLLGTSVRMLCEIGSNLKLYSYDPPPPQLTQPQQIEKQHRQTRNAERLWFGLWLFSQHISSHTGQRLGLADDGSIASCGGWHRRPNAAPQDAWLIASIALRRIVSRATDSFHAQLRRAMPPNATDGQPKPPSLGTGEGALGWELQVDFFRSTVLADLKRWEAEWLTPQESSASSHPTPLQILGPLHLEQARLIALSLPLYGTQFGSQDMPETLMPHYRDAYAAALSFLSIVVDRWALLAHLDNGQVATVTYMCVFALKLASGAQNAPLMAFVDLARVEDLVRTICVRLQGCPRDVPRHYACYLEDVLERWLGRPSSTAGAMGSESRLRHAPVDARHAPPGAHHAHHAAPQQGDSDASTYGVPFRGPGLAWQHQGMSWSGSSVRQTTGFAPPHGREAPASHMGPLREEPAQSGFADVAPAAPWESSGFPLDWFGLDGPVPARDPMSSWPPS